MTRLFLFIFRGVVVKGKCQGLMFSDFVSRTPFRQLRQFVPRLRLVTIVWLSDGHLAHALE